MKTIINKLVLTLMILVALGTASCVGDLDILPNDPNQLTPDKFKENPKDYIVQTMAKCYSGMAVSGQGGPNGDSDISGLDGGSSQYTRAIFMLNEFPTDESKWKFSDEGVFDLVTDTWGTGNVNIFGTYSRMYVHIAICNEFLRLVDDGNLSSLGISLDDETKALVEQFKLEARVLRAMSYYNIIDLFGNGGFKDETQPNGVAPEQKTRKELYDWLANELETLVAAMPDATPVYGRVGKDGAEALLARLYLNGVVFAGQDDYAKCAQHCDAIIARHEGKGGFNNSGLANHYLYLFCGDNDSYMPGGNNAAENEILWGIPYDAIQTQPYGGTNFLCKAGVADDAEVAPLVHPVNYGLIGGWTCMRATGAFADKFTAEPQDVRWSMWNKESDGFQKECSEFSKFTCGYGVIKFTNLLKGENGEWSTANGGIYSADPTNPTTARQGDFPDTDLPLIRLADVYLMYTESYIQNHGAGDAAKALKYVNYVRNRAGISSWTDKDLTADNILDERCRELYWENVRRTDLVRHGKFAGNAYSWEWKNNSKTGSSIQEYRNLFPIPSNVIAAQPEFKQNPGY